MIQISFRILAERAANELAALHDNAVENGDEEWGPILSKARQIVAELKLATQGKLSSEELSTTIAVIEKDLPVAFSTDRNSEPALSSVLSEIAVVGLEAQMLADQRLGNELLLKGLGLVRPDTQKGGKVEG